MKLVNWGDVLNWEEQKCVIEYFNELYANKHEFVSGCCVVLILFLKEFFPKVFMNVEWPENNEV
jgi:hypothetical protein